MIQIHRWWWPGFVFLYPLVFLPSSPGLFTVFVVRVYLVMIALIGGALLEWQSHSTVKLRHIRHAPQAFKRHPALGIALVYGLWVLIASALSPYPVISLTGSLDLQADSALWSVAMVLVFALVYSQAQRDSALPRRIYSALISSLGVLAVLALVEVLRQQPLIYPGTDASFIPFVMSPGQGHLAGVFVLGASVGLSYWYQSVRTMLPVLLLFCFAMGLTQNRSSIGALVVGSLIGFRYPKLLAVVVAAAIASYSLGIALERTVDVEQAGTRTLQSAGSLEFRLILWEIGLDGIAARPLTGWGGGQFHYFFHEVASEEAVRRLIERPSNSELLSVIPTNDIYGARFLLETTEGERFLATQQGFKIHNQFLDIAVLWGLVGLALYGALLALTLPNLLRLHPAALGIIVYHLYLMLWFSQAYSEGLMFVVWALAVMPLKAAQQKETVADR